MFTGARVFEQLPGNDQLYERSLLYFLSLAPAFWPHFRLRWPAREEPKRRDCAVSGRD